MFEGQREQSKDRRGSVYVISNPAFPGYVKVGRAMDVEDRLSSYQTADPLRRYKLEGYVNFADRYAAEKEAHRLLLPYWAGGEWFLVNTEEALRVIQSIHSDR